MTVHRSEAAVLRHITQWAEAKANVRAVILTSSRARDEGPVDVLSDYDVILYATDPMLLLSNRSWTGELGSVLVQMPSAGQERAWSTPTRLVLYEDGTKIDFTILPLGDLITTAEGPNLPAELDAGYRILLDKDNLTTQLAIPSGSAYTLRRPTQEEFTAVVEEFWWEASYVAKNLWREDLLPAKYSLECVLKLDLLRRMLEWRAAIDQGWTFRPGVMGRGLQAHMAVDRWIELEETYAGPIAEENWRALSRTIRLFRGVAGEVSQHLALAYPDHLDARMTDYLRRIRTTVGASKNDEQHQ